MKDINQGSGFWSLNPYLAVSYLPSPGWEMSARFHYLYNLPTDRFANPPSIAGLTLRDGQAGQAVHVNFTASREIVKSLSVGVNGYFLQQVAQDRVNGDRVPNTSKRQLYLGPGVHWVVSAVETLNVNLYLPVDTRGTASGPQLNLHWIRTF